MGKPDSSLIAQHARDVNPTFKHKGDDMIGNIAQYPLIISHIKSIQELSKRVQILEGIRTYYDITRIELCRHGIIGGHCLLFIPLLGLFVIGGWKGGLLSPFGINTLIMNIQDLLDEIKIELIQEFEVNDQSRNRARQAVERSFLRAVS